MAPPLAALRPFLLQRAALGTVLASVAGAQHVTRLSAPLPRVVVGSVYEYAVTPDGAHVVYRAHQSEEDGFGVYVVPSDGSAEPLRLSLPDAPGLGGARGFRLSADGTLVVFDYGPKELFSGEPYQLYSVPVDGSRGPLLLKDTAASKIHAYEISPDGQRVLFLTHLDTYQVIELYAVPIQGGPTIKLNTPLPTGRDVEEFAIDASSTRVVYCADQDTDNRSELYGVPIDGSAAAVRLSHAMTGPEEVLSFRIAGTGDRVVYQANTVLPSRDVYSAPLDGSAAAVRLNESDDTLVYVTAYLPSPDGSRVVYLADQTTNLDYELYSVPADGSAGAVKLNGPLVGDGDVRDFWITPDGAHVVYLADEDVNERDELYAAPIAASGAAVKLSRPMPPGGEVSTLWSAPLVSPDGARVVYLADQETAGTIEAFSVKVDGTSNRKLNADMPAGRFVDRILIAPDSASVVFRANGGGPPIELSSTPIGGGGPVTALAAGDVTDPGVGPDGARVTFLSPIGEGRELSSRPIDASLPAVTLNSPLVTESAGALESFALSPDGNAAVYRGEQDEEFVHELYRASLHGGPPVRLNDPLPEQADVNDYRISADSQWVAYTADQEVQGSNELYTVPIDRSTGPVRVSLPATPGQGVLPTTYNPGFAISDDSQWVVYRRLPQENLYSAPMHVPGASIQIDVPPSGNHDVYLSFQIAPGSAHVVYVAVHTLPGKFELFGAPIDGSASAWRLNDPLPDEGRVANEFHVAPDGQRVAFLARPAFTGPYELYGAPVDGSGAPVRLNGTLVAGGSVQRVYPPTAGGRVVYVADELTQGVAELFSVPIDGSAAPVRLNDDFPGGTGIFPPAVRVAPDGTHVVYVAAQETPGLQELFSVPIDGAAAPTRLSASNGNVAGFDVAARTGRVVFLVPGPATPERRLYSVPIGGGVPVELNGPLANDRQVATFRISANGRRVAFLADAAVLDELELFEVGIAGAPTARRMSLPLAPGGAVQQFALTADGSRAVHLSEHRAVGEVELFSSALTLPATW